MVVGRADHRVHADEATVGEAVEATGDAAGLLVTIGSGTMADIGKVVSLRRGLPHIVVQTAASVNGFADDQSVLLVDGAKRTTPTRWPDALVIDLDVIAAAPIDLNRAGVGDLASMFTAPADWLLASTIGFRHALRLRARLARPTARRPAARGGSQIGPASARRPGVPHPTALDQRFHDGSGRGNRAVVRAGTRDQSPAGDASLRRGG